MKYTGPQPQFLRHIGCGGRAERQSIDLRSGGKGWSNAFICNSCEQIMAQTGEELTEYRDPNLIVESLGFLLDRLVIANLKCHQMNHRQIEIERKDTPSEDEHHEHTKLARDTRIVNEERVALKNAIDVKLKSLIESGEYGYTAEVRTYNLGADIDRLIAESVKEHA